MNTDSEKEAIEELKRRKDNFRAFTRNLSPTEKIRQLELLQKRHYELLKAREENGGVKFPKSGESGALPKISDLSRVLRSDWANSFLVKLAL